VSGRPRKFLGLPDIFSDLEQNLVGMVKETLSTAGTLQCGSDANTYEPDSLLPDAHIPLQHVTLFGQRQLERSVFQMTCLASFYINLRYYTYKPSKYLRYTHLPVTTSFSTIY
jgi:hypothetical protein